MGKGQKGKKHSSSPAPDHKHDTNGKLAEDDFPTGPPEPLYSLPERKHQTEEAERRAWLRSLTWLQRLCYQSYRATQALLPLWFLFFVLGCWAVYYDHETVAQWALPIPYLQAKGEQASLLQLVPTTRHASWQLGSLAGQAKLLTSQLQASQSSDAASIAGQIQDLCQQAAKLLSVDASRITADVLQQIGQLIESHEKQGGVLSKVRGLFKFANLMWLVGILGVSISLGPALVVLFGPIIRILIHFAKTVTIVVWAVIRPFVRAAILYLLLCVISAAQTQPKAVASFITLGAVLTAVVTLIHGTVGTRRSSFFRDDILVYNAFACLVLVPLALKHSSPLLGFFAATALFGALGFAVVPMYCGWLVGWATKYQMVQTAITSALIIALSIGARAAGVSHAVMEPFQLGLNVYGTNCLLLAGLIMSGRYYNARFFVLRNVAYFVLVIGLCLAGAFFGMDSLYTVGCTYMALWLSQGGIAWAFDNGLGIVGVLAGSLLTCAGAYFIHTHPDWLIKMLSS